MTSAELDCLLKTSNFCLHEVNTLRQRPAAGYGGASIGHRNGIYMSASVTPLDVGPLLPFALADQTDQEHRYSASSPVLLCFVKDDCPTCHEVVPLLEVAYQQLGTKWPVILVGQTEEGNQKLKEKYKLSVPILNDSDLKVSYAYGIDTVPTLFAANPEGASLEPLVGFVSDEWQARLTQCAELVGVNTGWDIAWGDLPEWRPGCGSLSVDPVHADRLRAEAENSPLRARRLELGSADDEFEFMFDQGFSDGLPLVPPTPERVLRMLDGCSRDPQSLVAIVPPNMGEATVEKVAINAVMAGCKPQYLPVVIAALEAVCTDAFNIHGVMATTMGASPVMVVNGPIRHRLEMNMGVGVLGQGNRANATIGRALRLAIRNIGGAKPGGTERSTLGNPMKFTMCFAEWEECNPWSPLHVERGYAPDESVVTVFGMTSGPTLIVDQDSRSASQLGGSFGLCLESVFHPKAHGGLEALVVVCPEHVDTFMRDGYTKANIRDRIQEVTATPLRNLVADDISAVGLKAEQAARMDASKLDRMVPKFLNTEDIHLVVAGSDAGKFSGAFHGWATGNIGTISQSQKIDA